MVGKDTQIKQKKTSAGYTDPCPMQETVGIPQSPVRIMGQETGAESQVLTGAEDMLLWDRKTGEQHQMDLGKVGLLNCDGRDDRGRAVEVTMVNWLALPGRVPYRWKSAKRKALVITSIKNGCDDTLCRTVRAGGEWRRWSNKSLCLGGEHGDWSRVWEGLCLMHGGLQHVHSSSMGIQRAHIGCKSHSDERGSGRGRRKSKTIADTCGPDEKFRFVEGKKPWRSMFTSAACSTSRPRGSPVGQHVERSRRLIYRGR